MYKYSILDAKRMSKLGKAVFAFCSMFVLVGGVAYIALSIYMLLKACIG